MINETHNVLRGRLTSAYLSGFRFDGIYESLKKTQNNMAKINVR